MTSSEMISPCEILGFGEVIWQESVGTMQGSHQLDYDAMQLQMLTAGSRTYPSYIMFWGFVLLLFSLHSIRVMGVCVCVCRTRCSMLHDHTRLCRCVFCGLHASHFTKIRLELFCTSLRDLKCVINFSPFAPAQ